MNHGKKHKQKRITVVQKHCSMLPLGIPLPLQCPSPSKGIIHYTHLPPKLSMLSLSLIASPWSMSISPPPCMRDWLSECRTAFTGGRAGAEEGITMRYLSHM